MDNLARQQFEAAIVRNLLFWTTPERVLDVAAVNQIKIQQTNLLRAVHYGLHLPSARRATADLLIYLSPIVGGRLRLELLWLPLFTQLARVADQLATEIQPQFALAYAHLLRLNGQLLAAEKILSAVLPQLTDQPHKTHILFELSECYRESNAVAQGLTYAEQALHLARGAADDIMCAKILNSLGMLADQIGDFAQGDRYFAEAYQIEQLYGDATRIVRVLINWANLFHHQKQLLRAMRLYMQAQSLLDQSENENNNLLVLLNLGVIYFDLDQFDKAERAFCAAVQRLPHRGGWYALEAQIKTNLGAVYQATERHEAAIVVLVEAVQKWREVGNLLCLCRALLNLAESQIVLMHHAVAFDTCLEAGIWLEFYPEQHQAGEMLLECQQIGEMLAEAQGIGRN